MAKRPRESLEHGPRSLGGVVLPPHDPTHEQALPAIDPSVGAAQRFRVRVPTASTTLLLGKRVPEARMEDDTQLLGYDGANAITHAHVFVSGSKSATLQAAGRVYAVSTGSSLAAVAREEVLVGTQGNAAVGTKGQCLLVANNGPTPTAVDASGTTPASPSHPDYQSIVGDLETAAIATTASIGLLGAALVLAGTTRKSELKCYLGYIGKAVSIVSKTKTLIEQATNRSVVAHEGGTDVSFWQKQSDAGEVAVYGKDNVTITAGASVGTSLTMFAPLSSVHGVGGLTAGLAGGVAASLTSTWSASVHALGVTMISSLLTTYVTALNKTSIESRKGKAYVAAPVVTIGEVLPIAPQTPTISATVTAGMKVALEAGMGTTSIELNGLLNTAEATALTKLSIDVLPWKLELTPAGVSIKAAALGASFTPAKLSLSEVTSKLELTAAGVTATSTPHALSLTPVQARIKGPFIVLG